MPSCAVTPTPTAATTTTATTATPPPPPPPPTTTTTTSSTNTTTTATPPPTTTTTTTAAAECLNVITDASVSPPQQSSGTEFPFPCLHYPKMSGAIMLSRIVGLSLLLGIT